MVSLILIKTIKILLPHTLRLKGGHYFLAPGLHLALITGRDQVLSSPYIYELTLDYSSRRPHLFFILRFFDLKYLQAHRVHSYF